MHRIKNARVSLSIYNINIKNIINIIKYYLYY